MPAGLQVFGADGSLILDATYRITRYVASIYLNGQNGSVEVPGGGQVWYAFQQSEVFTRNNLNNRATSLPRFSVSGNLLSWYYPTGGPNGAEIVSGWLFYGVY